MSIAKLELVPAGEFPLGELADLFTHSFAGYFVDIQDTAELLAQRLRVDSTDLHLSQVARIEGQPVAIILVSARGNTCRVSGMGVIESQRGAGIGRQLIEYCCRQLATLGYRRLTLEVIEQNVIAEALYRSLGFGEQRRLVGFERAPRDPPPHRRETVALIEIDARHVAREVAGDSDCATLPWQLAGESLIGYSPPARAFRLGDGASALLSDPRRSTILLQACIVRRQQRRQGWGRRLLEALERRFPQRGWQVPPRLPGGLADDFFRHLGFRYQPLSQLEMELDLSIVDLCPPDSA